MRRIVTNARSMVRREGTFFTRISRGCASQPNTGISEPFQWDFALVSALVTVGAGALWSGPVFRAAAASELGWTQRAVAGAFAVGSLASIPVPLLVGLAADGWGIHRVLVVGSGLATLALLGTGLTTALWQWYVTVVVLAIAVRILTSGASLAASIRARRGKSLGFVFASLGLGLTGGPLLTQVLLNTIGWRPAIMLEGGGLFLLGVLLFRLSLHVPQRRAATNYETTAAEENPRRFLLLVGFFVGNILMGFYDESVYQHAYWYGTSLGLSGTAAASVISAVSIAYILGGIAGGSLSDIIGRSAVLSAAALGSAATLFGFAHSTAESLWLWGAAFGVGLGTGVTVRSAVWADVFSGPRLGRDIGLLTPGFSLGVAVATYGGAAWIDADGTFQALYIVAAGAALAWAALNAALALSYSGKPSVAGTKESLR